MSVRETFAYLNSYRPSNSSFGEVTGIRLVHSWSKEFFSIEQPHREVLANTKRKSIHVPPSSNAYWNWMALRSGLASFFNTNGVERAVRVNLYKQLEREVSQIHCHSLLQTYQTRESGDQFAMEHWMWAGDELAISNVQYYNLVLCDNSPDGNLSHGISGLWDFITEPAELVYY